MSEYFKTIFGDRIDLIPYTREHVSLYNKWLENPEIQEMTETEPCSLEEEYTHQEAYESDNQRTKFIKLISLKDGTLIGDVNLFFNDDEAEINLMIAELEYRRAGYAREALSMIITYLKERSVGKVVAKILSKNEPSLVLFERFGFVGRDLGPNVFDEYTLILEINK